MFRMEYHPFGKQSFRDWLEYPIRARLHSLRSYGKTCGNRWSVRFSVLYIIDFAEYRRYNWINRKTRGRATKWRIIRTSTFGKP